jgi:dihydropteroate synthase
MADPLAWLDAPCVMGIVNATPDSLWGGGGPMDPEGALALLDRMAADGAAICDVGAESTRPGADPVDGPEQVERLSGVLRALRVAEPPLALSIDTSLAPVAEAALDAGFVLVNDVTAGRLDPGLLPLVAERGADLCLVHMRGDPRTMQDDPTYRDVVGEVRDFLAGRMEAALDAGVAEERIVLDPGIGFGKTLDHNLALLAGVPALAELGRPVLIGVSRKGMFGRLLGREVGERMPASVAAGLAAVARGAAVLRVHDVRETVDALRVWSAVGAAAR